MDPFLAGGGGIEGITRILERFPDLRVIVLTHSDRKADFVRAMRSGARAYLLKSVEGNELVDSIRLIARGGAVVYTSRGAELFSGPSHAGNDNEGRNGFDRLTDRERQILLLAAQGASNKEIATRCYVSPTTVKAHFKRVSEKLDVKNRTQAVAAALSRGYLDPLED